MFPPMSPLTERVRIDLEHQKIEREAAFRAQMGSETSLFNRIRCWLANLRLHIPITTPSQREPVSERQIASSGGGC